MKPRHLGLILLSALLFRVTGILFLSHPELREARFEFRYDEIQYHQLAVTLSESGRYARAVDGPPTALRTPGMILPLAFIYRLLRPSPLLAIGYVLLCSILLILVLRMLAVMVVCPARIESIAVLISALLPTLIFASSGIFSDLPALVFLTLSLYFAARGERQAAGWPIWALAGSSLAAAHLVRPGAAAFIPFVLGKILLSRGLRYRLKEGAVFALSSLAPIIAWGVRNVIVMDCFLVGDGIAVKTIWETNNPVTAGTRLPAMRYRNNLDLYEEAARGSYLGSWVPAEYIDGHGLDNDLTEQAAYRVYQERAWRFVRQEPLAWLRLVGYRFRRVLTAEPLAASITGEGRDRSAIRWLVAFVERWFILGFGVAGLCLLRRERQQLWSCFSLYALASLVVPLLTHPNARMLLPLSVSLIVPAAVGVERLSKRVGLEASPPESPSLGRLPGPSHQERANSSVEESGWGS